MASRDPLALDAATFALISEKRDIIEEVTGAEFGEVLREAETLGVGKTDGTLKRLS
jgi:uncharacterized Fe-S center protein